MFSEFSSPLIITDEKGIEMIPKNVIEKMDSSGFEPEASSMPRRRSSADLRALEVHLQQVTTNKICGHKKC